MALPTNQLNDSVHKVLSVASNPFKEIDTEKKFLTNLKAKGLFEQFYTHTINNEIVEEDHLGKTVLRGSEAESYTFKLRFVFKKIFEIDNLLSQTLNNTALLESDTHITNFVNGELYKQKKQQIGENKLLLPYFIYTDDFEVNNPLGSHAANDSICAVYISFPTIPQHLLSNLNFIFVAALIKSKYIKRYGTNAAFYKLTEEIKFLEEEGVDIISDGKTYRVHFVLGLILGDNLGVKTVLGFSKSFNCARYCRLCIRDKSDMQKDHVEYTYSLRSKDSYVADVEKQNPKTTGIVVNSIFNDIDSFHVTSNFSVDIMHDLYEGICRYEICQAILYFIEKDYFTLKFLNMRKRTFCYGEIEIGNRSGPLHLCHLKKNILKMTASETKTFVHFFTLIIGDKVPHSDEVWKLIISLIKIIDLVQYSCYSEPNIMCLQENISKHLKLYVKCFGQLKPKHHFLVHYCTVLRKSGPLRKMMCLRFEAKHKILKKYMNATSSRRNSAYSLARKVSYQFSSFLLNNKIPSEISEQEFIDEAEVSDSIKSLISSLNFNSFQFQYVTKIEFKGTMYKNKYYLSIFYNSVLSLRKIECILVNNCNECYIVSTEVLITKFDNHYQAYVVGRNTNNLYFNNIKEFTSLPHHIHTTSAGLTFVRNKFII